MKRRKLRRLSIRPATRADLLALMPDDHTLAYSVRGFVATVGRREKVIAGWGVAFVRGRVWAFCKLHDEARPYRVRMHKEAIGFIKDLRARHRLIYANADEREPTAVRWLTRLGFEHCEGTLYRLWQN